jgi:transketolase
VLYDGSEEFAIGKAKVLRRRDGDKALIVGAGVTVHEALKAYDTLQKEGTSVCVVDLFSVQPIDSETLQDCARWCGLRVITVEDHYAHGGLGDAVAAALAGTGAHVRKLAVRDIPRSGKPEELLDRFGISARAIVEAVKA